MLPPARWLAAAEARPERQPITVERVPTVRVTAGKGSFFLKSILPSFTEFCMHRSSIKVVFFLIFMSFFVDFQLSLPKFVHVVFFSEVEFLVCLVLPCFVYKFFFDVSFDFGRQFSWLWGRFMCGISSQHFHANRHRLPSFTEFGEK